MPVTIRIEKTENKKQKTFIQFLNFNKQYQ